MKESEMQSTAKALVAPGKGILAADESFPTIEKRFAKINLEPTEETRRAYRELLFKTPGIEKFISGVIMFDETIRQKTKEGTPFPDVLTDRGILPGIKVDKGTEDISGYPAEKQTKGLEGLAGRLSSYRKLGARFTKWRAVYKIAEELPTQKALDVNGQLLAEYAFVSQQAGLLPIVEPEVLMEGDHPIQRCEEVTTRVLSAVFSKLADRGVALSGMLLKTNMVLPGKDSPNQVSDSKIAEATFRALKRTVPAQVPSVAFLSGGQTPEQATARLNEMNKRSKDLPWQLSFSYARALQDPVLKAWNGHSENVAAAQKIFLKRARLNSLARFGKYSPEMENE